ncbi:MAG: hypothetical protein IKD13_01285 [Firmicutes bacterium]|nr:hypothetical protein [Bacillota bacterium]
MEAGRVLIGFSYPVVAKYNYDGKNVTYSDGRVLARGVSVSLDLETSDDNNFYADNKLAESENGDFNGGTAALTVDGMHPESERFALGLPEPEAVPYGESKTVKITKHGANAKPPYLAMGYITQYQSGGDENIFVPTILTKGKFRTPKFDAKTREGKKDWQTQELTLDLHRDETEGRNWKWVAEDQTSEAAAMEILNALLNVTAPAEGA